MLFLPSWPLTTSPLLLFCVLLLAGVAGGELARRLLKLPRISGYVLTGVAIAQLYDNIAERPIFAEMRIFADIALGLVLFMLGRRLDLSWLRRDPWLAITSVAENAVTFTVVFTVLSLFGLGAPWAAVAAAVAMSTSPAVVMLIVRDTRAEGQVTERLLCLAAMNSVFAVITVTMLVSWLHLEYRAGLDAVLLHPLYLIVGSLLLAVLMAFLLMRAARLCGKRETVQFALIVGAVLLTVALADMLKLSVLIALLAMGVLLRNVDTQRNVSNTEFGYAAEPFFIILFVIIGVRLPLDAMGAAFWPALALFSARVAAKCATIFAVGWLGGMPARKSWLLGLGLTPLSGVATLLVSDAAALYPDFGKALAAIVLGAIVMGDLVGPLATQFALRRAGETNDQRR